MLALAIALALTPSSFKMTFEAMMNKVTKDDGFLAALDQSGGSTPKALKLYGIPDDVRFQMRTPLFL